MINADKLETGYGTITQLWGRMLPKPIEYSYLWVRSDDKKENKERRDKARVKAIRHLTNYMGMER